MPGSKLIAALALLGMIPLLDPAVRAEEKCPVEVKLLLSPPTTQSVIASLRFEKEKAGRVYFFDTEALDLLMQGVIVRVRQGAINDLTVKVRLPQGDPKVDGSRLPGRFPCEVDRNQMGESTSYAIKRAYRANVVPASGGAIRRLLSPSQRALLREARVSLDWPRVVRVADIRSTRWQTTARSPPGELALELWEWPAGRVLELSAKASFDAAASKYEELERLVRLNDLSLDANQDAKTSVVLKGPAGRAAPAK